MPAEWARDVRDQCRAAGAALFVKQMARRDPIPDDPMIREFPA
jgi:protein gp37